MFKMRFRLSWLGFMNLVVVMFVSFVLVYKISAVENIKTKLMSTTNGSLTTYLNYLWVEQGDQQNISSSNTPILKAKRTLQSGLEEEEEVPLPMIYMITPTYRRAEQIPELTRTAQTLLNVQNLVWIVVEDAPKTSADVLQYLERCNVKNVYMRVEMPKKFALAAKKPRGVANRNAGIQWVRENAPSGVVYFGDDDNTYDLRIFEEIRSTKRVSMFPVGLVTDYGISSPIVRNGKVVGFYDGWVANRKFPVDMAGFAVNVQLFLDHPKAEMPFVVGYEEDGILVGLNIKKEEIEPKAENCTKIWVWHTQTKKNGPYKKSGITPSHGDTNLPALQKLIWTGLR